MNSMTNKRSRFGTEKTPTLSVCISSHNRGDSLLLCLNSLALLKEMSYEVIAIDDGSRPPLSRAIEHNLDAEVCSRLRLIRYSQNCGHIRCRNELIRLSRAPFVLQLDDDVSLYDSQGIYSGVEVLENDPHVGAIALAELDNSGNRCPETVQPGSVPNNCYVPTFIGYGAILRRDVFLKIRGYKEMFEWGGEEGDYCKRMLNLGYRVVYLPNSVVVHSHSPVGRHKVKRLAFLARNSIFSGILNEPLLLLFVTVPLRLLLYLHKQYHLSEDLSSENVFSLKWLVSQILTNFKTLWADRAPLKWTTHFEWKIIKNRKWPYLGATSYTAKAIRRSRRHFIAHSN